jgi:(1->4)-alpha-D-glucan 1-alpha-D-glucosylmutase
MFTMARALAARAQWRDVYEHGDYVPLSTSGAGRDSLFAFARVSRGRAPRQSEAGGDHALTITCVPRIVASLMPDPSAPPLGRSVWTDTRVELPPGQRDPIDSCALLRDAFTGAEVRAERIGGVWTIPAAVLFAQFPVALLVPATPRST